MKKSAALQPNWVSSGLWGINTRRTAMLFSLGSIFVSIAAGIYALEYADNLRRTFFSTVMSISGLMAAAWYLLCVRWVDKNTGW